MKKLFISYARENKGDVDQLVEHLRMMGYDSWVDVSLRAGQDWWEEILRRIAEADAFVAVVSRSVLDSTACHREFEWAENLGKLVLPVAVDPAVVDPAAALLLPSRFAKRQIIDYSQPEKRAEAALLLQGGLGALPPSPQLPDPLPDPPAAPLSYLSDVVDLVTQPNPLDHEQQRQILTRLEPALRAVDPDERRAGQDLLRRFAQREDLYADVDRRITRYSEGSPGYPPPEPPPTGYAPGPPTPGPQPTVPTPQTPTPQPPAPPPPPRRHVAKQSSSAVTVVGTSWADWRGRYSVLAGVVLIAIATAYGIVPWRSVRLGAYWTISLTWLVIIGTVVGIGLLVPGVRRGSAVRTILGTAITALGATTAVMLGLSGLSATKRPRPSISSQDSLYDRGRRLWREDLFRGSTLVLILLVIGILLIALAMWQSQPSPVPDNALWWLGGGVAILTALAALNNPRHFWGYESGDGIYEQDMADGMVAIQIGRASCRERVSSPV